ncbi:bifunctional non-homologous end joining protein LigD [Rhizobiales bacterium GAS188]|nr:bifunctional non-homologous end joining protein LigD [Rhizobiales bacterium GAS188]
MARLPKKPRVLRRKIDEASRVASRTIARHQDLRQGGPLDVSPTWIEPCQPVLVKTPPAGPDWLHEIKHDGYRAISVVDRGAVKIFTRRGHDWADRMSGIREALASLKVRSAVIDGEVVMMGDDGVADFFALHAALTRREAPGAVLIAFDALHLDGEDLRGRALEERRAILAKLLRKPKHQLQFSEEIAGEGREALRAACDMGLEGIVSKRRGLPYRSGKTDAWRKSRCTQVENFAVIGAGPPARAPVRSLRLARLVAGSLVPCGWAGSGLSERDGRDLRMALDAGRPVVAEIEYRGMTPAGDLRHPVVKACRAG